MSSIRDSADQPFLQSADDHVDETVDEDALDNAAHAQQEHHQKYQPPSPRLVGRLLDLVLLLQAVQVLLGRLLQASLRGREKKLSGLEALESGMCDVIKIRILKRRDATRSGKGNHQPLNIKTAV